MAIPPNISWDQVLRHGPRVLDAATALFDKWQAKKPEPVDPQAELRQQLATVVQRLQAIEEAQAAQSAVTRELAEQLQAQNAVLARTQDRLKQVLWLAVVSMLLALAAGAMLLLR